MKIRSLAIIAFFSLTPSCYFGGGFDNAPIVLSSEADSAASRSRGGRGRGRSRNSGSSKACEGHRDCENMCEDVYDDGDEEDEGKVEACLEVNYKTAIQFKDILEALRDPSDSKLRNIEHRAFSKFLDVSVAPWVEEAVDRASRSDAEILLTWIAKERNVANAIVSAYSNYETEFDLYEGVEELLGEIRSVSSCSGFCGSVNKGIVGNRLSFWDIADQENNSYAKHIICEIFDDKCDSDKSNTNCQTINSVCPVSVSVRAPRSSGGGSGSNAGGGSRVNTDNYLDSTVYIYTPVGICDTDDAVSDHRTCIENCAGNVNVMTCIGVCNSSSSDCSTDGLIGSGVFQARNRVLTNHHVVEVVLATEAISSGGKHIYSIGDTAVTARSGSDKEALLDSVIWHDATDDIALVELDESLPGAFIPSHGSLSQLQLRDELWTVGNPGGVRWTVSEGHLTNKNPGTIGTCRNCITYSIPVGGGNSGGPVFNNAGQLMALHAFRLLEPSGRAYSNLAGGPHIDRIKHLIQRGGSGNVANERVLSRDVRRLSRSRRNQLARDIRDLTLDLRRRR